MKAAAGRVTFAFGGRDEGFDRQQAQNEPFTDDIVRHRASAAMSAGPDRG
jgi:hypothetical protein